MDELVLHGVRMLTLTNLVRKYLTKAGNLKQSALIANLLLAQDAYRALYCTTIYVPKKTVIDVNDDGTFKLPDEREKLLGIFVVDALGKEQELTLNPYYNTVDAKCSTSSCSCGTCKGNNTLCAAIDAITRTTETITIHDVDYTQTTWVKNDCEGNIQQAIETPYWDTVSGSVIFKTEYSTICTVTVNENGCIQYTAPNIAIFRAYFGYSFNLGYCATSPSLRELIPVSPNNYGYYNFNAADPDIVHVFRRKNNGPPTSNVFNPITQTTETVQNDIRQVIVSCQTSGTAPGAEILVPEYAVPAIEGHMMWQTELRNPNKRTRSSVDLLKQNWYVTKDDVRKYLFKISMRDMALLQTQPRLW